MSLPGRKWMSVCLVLAAGCATRGNVDMLESELRRYEELQVDLEDRIGRLETDLRVAQSDADSLRLRLTQAGDRPPTVEESHTLHRVTQLNFHTLMTGGWDKDAAPGDEGIAVVLTPLDEHGDLVKLPGETEIELLDLSQTGDDQKLGFWKFSSEELVSAWHKGVIGSGFLLRMPWQQLPRSEKLTLVARLKTADGRKFDATTQVTVSPPNSVVARQDDDLPPSSYRITAEPVSVPRRLPRSVNEVMPSDEPIQNEKLPPVPPEERKSRKPRFEKTSSTRKPAKPGTADPLPEQPLSSSTEVPPPVDLDEPATLESDSWTIDEFPVRR